MLDLIPIDFSDACHFVEKHHRHHGKPQGHKYSIGAAKNGEIVGVVMVGRPVARQLDDGWTLEVIRCCTNGEKNACSFLYSAAWRVARNMGYKRMITYILKSESGISLIGAGWKLIGECGGGSWNCRSRPRIDKHPTQLKLRFEICNGHSTD